METKTPGLELLPGSRSFADVESLQTDFVRHEPGTAPDGTTAAEPFVTLDWTFVLAARADGQ